MKTVNAARSTDRTIAILGGGASGALTAYHLRQQGVPARIVLIDPRADLGFGLAYSTPSMRHLLNVPAGKISALADKPDHFLNWLRLNHNPDADEETFAPRAVFGRYVNALVNSAAGIEQVQDMVVDYTPANGGALLTLGNGSKVRADLVVLATGNFNPSALPGIGAAAISSGAYRHNAWLPDTFDDLAVDAPVTLIGTGLTGVDVLLRLRELGHRGTITAVSRHGIFPSRHAPYAHLSHPAIPAGTPATCVAYLRAVRAMMRAGAEWRAVIDSLRATTNDLWLALSQAEQQRFRRHLQRRWDVVRHRMAPPIADRIEAELAAGTLVVRSGRLTGVEAAGEGAVVAIRRHGATEAIRARRVVNCTGPAMNYRHVESALLKSLFLQGLVTAGPLGTGFDCSADGAMIGADGLASEVLFNLGPGRLGNLLESIAIPEIRQQAKDLATIVAGRIGARTKPDDFPLPKVLHAAAQAEAAA